MNVLSSEILNLCEETIKGELLTIELYLKKVYCAEYEIDHHLNNSLLMLIPIFRLLRTLKLLAR